MTKSISGNELLEYGSFQGNMFGTKIETIQKIHEQGKIALLDVEPQVSQLYRSRLLEPFWKYLKWWDWRKLGKYASKDEWFCGRIGREVYRCWRRSKPTTPPVHTSLLGSADFTRLLLTYLFFSISLNQTLKVLRTADFAPLVVFIAPTNTAAQVPKTLSRIRSGTSKRL